MNKAQEKIAQTLRANGAEPLTAGAVALGLMDELKKLGYRKLPEKDKEITFELYGNTQVSHYGEPPLLSDEEIENLPMGEGDYWPEVIAKAQRDSDIKWMENESH